MLNSSHQTLVRTMMSLKARGFSMPSTRRITMDSTKGMVLPPMYPMA